MAWLTGPEITKQVRLGRIRIDPFRLDQCNPNSYDYRLGNTLKLLKLNSQHKGTPCIDPRLPSLYEEVVIPTDGYLLETPNAYLGYTVEQFGSDHYACLVTGKSSVGRLFVKNHACAGPIDQGFFGHITLEITAKLPTLIFPGMKLGQIFFFEVCGKPNLYNGKYKENNKGIPSQIIKDWDS
ncbi:MAG: 2'-deoxycytidine 5'-triphosphate deaminase [Pseudomonadota bacterium]|nr:2'-deoxycytidine 5'-triphosphate deaminase [Pseudomonadota bacterium]